MNTAKHRNRTPCMWNLPSVIVPCGKGTHYSFTKQMGGVVSRTSLSPINRMVGVAYLHCVYLAPLSSPSRYLLEHALALLTRFTYLTRMDLRRIRRKKTYATSRTRIILLIKQIVAVIHKAMCDQSVIHRIVNPN